MSYTGQKKDMNIVIFTIATAIEHHIQFPINKLEVLKK